VEEPHRDVRQGGHFAEMRTYMVNVEGLDDTREAGLYARRRRRLVRRFAGELICPFTPTEHKTVQARILAYVQEIGWTYVPRGEAEERRGFDYSKTTLAEQAADASPYFEAS